MTIVINGKNLTIEQVKEVARDWTKVALNVEAIDIIKKWRNIVEDFVSREKKIYGVTTWFWVNSQTFISAQDASQLQINLARSHAAWVGEYAAIDVVRATMLIRANLIASGITGARLIVVDTMIELLNKWITPAIPMLWSVWSSWDLAPLSYIVLVLMGERKVWYQWSIMNTQDAFELAQINPIDIQCKEWLAIMNGATYMAWMWALCVYDAEYLSYVSDVAFALTFEAIRWIPGALDERIHLASGFMGQVISAQNIRNMIQWSEIIYQDNDRVQDSFSIRCGPRILWASRQAIDFVKNQILIEINWAADNPLVLIEDEDILSWGNFHGQPIALPLDYLKLAISELANVSEIRIERIVNPAYSEFPPFLVKNPWLQSGFMVVQYTQWWLINMNKSLCWPNSCDSIPLCGWQEDHVAMWTNAAINCMKIIDNTQYVLACEILTSCQALDFRVPRLPGYNSRKIYEFIRSFVPFIEKDTVLTPYIEQIKDVISKNTLPFID